jgi:hypothetical protein
MEKMFANSIGILLVVACGCCPAVKKGDAALMDCGFHLIPEFQITDFKFLICVHLCPSVAHLCVIFSVPSVSLWLIHFAATAIELNQPVAHYTFAH